MVGGLSKLAVVAGTVVAGGLGLASKRAMDFEDAFAGVRKTVDTSPEGLERINRELRTLATRIPVQFTDLANIAQEAGALGVPAERVANFTEVVSRLSAATVGLTTDAAAEAFGKLGNVLGLNADKSGKSYERLGSALIKLGNDAASSEGDIIEVAKRFGAAGSQAGLSADQVLGFASAIASLGVEPEAAGSALSRIFNKITTYIGTGDEKIKAFAKATHMSVGDFSRLFERDAAGAVQTFLKSLNGLSSTQVAKVLKEGGLTNVRDVNVIQLLSQNYQELNRQLGISAEAYAKNTELQTVSEKRFDTLKNHLITFKNTLIEGAVAMGEGFNPALGRLIEKARAFVTTHMPDLRRLGVEIGAAIDDIDWTRVESGARNVADAARVILDVLSKIPPEVDLAVAGFLGLNKVTGGALSQVAGGALDMAKGLAGLALRGVAGRGGAGGKLAGGLAALTATPVYITGVAPGVMLGGGLPGGGAPSVVGGGGGVLGFLKGAAALALAGMAVDLYATQLAPLNEGNASQTQAIAENVSRNLVSATTEQLEIQRQALAKGLVDIQNATSMLGPLQGILYGGQIDTLRAQLAAVQSEMDTRDGGLRGRDLGSRDTGLPTPAAAELAARRAESAESRGVFLNAARMQQSAADVLLQGLHVEFRQANAALAKARDPQGIQAGVKALMASIVGKGIGGIGGARAAIRTLESKLQMTSDPQTRSVLRAAIAAVQRKLPERQWVQSQLDKATEIARGTHSSTAKIAELTRIQRAFTAKGDTRAAAIVGAKIDAEKKAVAAAAKRAGDLTSEAIREKNMIARVTVGGTTVITNVRIGVGETIKSQQTYRKLGGATIS